MGVASNRSYSSSYSHNGEASSITEKDGAKEVNLVVNITIIKSQMQEAEPEPEEKDEQSDSAPFTRDTGHAAEKRGVQNSKSISAEKDGAKAEAKAKFLEKETKKDSAKAKGRKGGKAKVKAGEEGYVYGKPVDFCEVSERWRDKSGCYCRPPSPAREESLEFVPTHL